MAFEISHNVENISWNHLFLVKIWFHETFEEYCFHNMMLFLLLPQFFQKFRQINVILKNSTVILFDGKNNCVAQCGKLSIVLLFWFYMKAILIDFKKSKTVVLTILAALYFQICNSQKPKIQSLQNYQNGNFWPSEFSQNWFHVKLDWQKNC